MPGYTDNEIHGNQISPKHANNIPAGACLSSRAGFVWFLQSFFFLMSLLLLFSPSVFIMCLLWRLLHACQLSGGGGQACQPPKLLFCTSLPPLKDAVPTVSLLQPCLDKEPNTTHKITGLFNPIIIEQNANIN